MSLDFHYWPSSEVDPCDVPELYAAGHAGCLHDPRAREAFLATCAIPFFADVAHEYKLTESGKGKLSLPYLATLSLNPKELPGPAQGTGCCASRAAVNAITQAYANEVWAGQKDHELQVAERWPEVKYPAEQTFDHVIIYGERGHRGQGASASWMVQVASTRVGLLPRGKYTVPGYGTYDCTRYSDRAAARSGPSWSSSLETFAHKHALRNVTGASQADEVRDALAMGCGVSCGSGLAVNSIRPTITDGNGRSCAGANPRRGRWLHAMATIGCDDRKWAHSKYGGPLFLIQNSWGEDFHSGPRRVYGTDFLIPHGSFWVTAKTYQWALDWDDTVVVSSAKGFPRKAMAWW